MTMTGFDQYIQRAQTKAARDQRLAKVRACIGELLRDEKEELLVELLAELNPGDASSQAEPAVSEEGDGTNGSGRRVSHTKPEGYTVAQAIRDAMSDGKARPAGDIASVTKAMHAWVNVNSIPAAIARMVADSLLIKRGKSRLGRPKYVIAPQPETTP